MRASAQPFRLNLSIFYLSVSPDLDVGLRVEGVTADGQDVQVVAELTHPLEVEVVV